MGEALGEGGGGFIEFGLGGRLAGEVAEDGVDHAGGVRVVGRTDELYGLREGCVGRNAVEVEELEGTETERDGHGRHEGLIGSLEEGLDASVEGDLPAEDAEDERGRKVAIGLGEGGHARAVEEVVGVRRCGGDTEEDVEGGGAGWGDGGVGW
jgi:hypothetical protein